MCSYEFLLIYTSIHSNYSLYGKSIAQVNVHRDLGLILQENLKWDNHYNHISAKAYRQLGLIKRTFSSINSVFTKKRLYLSLVRSQLTYGSMLWRPLLIKDITSLEKIQRRATKFILGHNSTNLSYKERLIQLNILPLMYYLELADIMMFVNSYKSTSCRFNILQFVTVSNSNTRSSDKLTLKHTISFSNQQRHFILIVFRDFGILCHLSTLTYLVKLSESESRHFLSTLTYRVKLSESESRHFLSTLTYLVKLSESKSRHFLSTSSDLSSQTIRIRIKTFLIDLDLSSQTIRIKIKTFLIDFDLSSQTIRIRIKTFLWEQFLNNFVSDCPCTFHFKCPCSRCS